MKLPKQIFNANNMSPELVKAVGMLLKTVNPFGKVYIQKDTFYNLDAGEVDVIIREAENGTHLVLQVKPRKQVQVPELLLEEFTADDATLAKQFGIKF